MLKHQEDAEATGPVSAPQARVTPEELSEALAAIEARKQAEASRLAGTIPIEQAISEMHLDSSPEELWAEVLVQRRRAQTEQAQAAQEQAQAAQEQARQKQAAGPQTVAPERRDRRRQSARIAGPLLGLWTLFHFGIIPNVFSHHPAAVHQGQIAPLSQISDGVEVYANSAALSQISEGKPLARISVDKNQGDNNWTLFKRGGHVYLCGYILETPSVKAIAGESLTVFNADNPDELEGGKTSNITLRVDNVPLQTYGGDDSSYSEFTLPNFQPDPLTTLTPQH